MLVQGSKPWRYTGEEEYMEREDIKMVVKRWWDIYEDPSLDYIKNNDDDDEIVVKADEHVKVGPPFIDVISETDAVDQRSAPSAA